MASGRKSRERLSVIAWIKESIDKKQIVAGLSVLAIAGLFSIALRALVGDVKPATAPTPGGVSTAPAKSTPLILASPSKATDALLDLGAYSSVSWPDFEKNALDLDKTGLQRQLYIQPLLGKRILWRGELSDVQQDHRETRIWMWGKNKINDAVFTMQTMADPLVLASLHRGMMVQLSGNIDSVDAEVVWLRDGVLKQ